MLLLETTVLSTKGSVRLRLIVRESKDNKIIETLRLAADDPENRRKAVVRLVELANDPENKDGNAQRYDRMILDAVDLALKNADAEDAAEDAPEDEKDDKKKETVQSAKLVEIATDAEAVLFHTSKSEPYATIGIDGHRETYRINSQGFRLWLKGLYYHGHGRPAGSQAVQDALEVLASMAIFEGPELQVALRIARKDDAIYLDLCDREWRVVRITPENWEVVQNGPVKFVRRGGMLALPIPTRGGHIDDLHPFVNVPAGDMWTLVKGWILGSFRPEGPYAILAVNGEHGSAKTCFSKMLRALADPNEADLRSPPKDITDLIIAASNGWVVAFDNLSKMPVSLSDELCRLSTGSAFGKRQLYTDDEEKLFSASRPILFNGIEEVATRPDLLDRSILIELPVIDKGNRREEAALWRAFHAALPGILGGVLDAVSAAMRNEPHVHMEDPPRMADFAKWATAGESAMGVRKGEFMAAYTMSREGANDLAIEASSVAPCVLKLMHERDDWSGTSQELLTELETRHSDEKTRRHDDWPKNPRGMSAALRRVAPNLRQKNLSVRFPKAKDRRGKNRDRLLHLEWVGERPSGQSAEATGAIENAVQADCRAPKADCRPDSSDSDSPPENLDSGAVARVADGADCPDGHFTDCSKGVSDDADDGWEEVA